MSRAPALTPLGMALVLATSVAATPATAQSGPAAPGVPPSRYGWEYDLEVANRLYDNGYLDAAEKDYTKILTAYPDEVAGIDSAWLGLAKVHQARGETSRARASLQEVLRRDAPPQTAVEARDRYRSLRASAEQQINEARRGVFYYEARYQQTSWFNPFGKLFHYLDFRKAKKNYEKMVADVDKFDPRFLIEPVVRPSVHASADAGAHASEEAGGDAGTPPAADGSTSGTYRLSPEEMAALLGAAGGGSGDGTSDQMIAGATGSGDGTAEAEPGAGDTGSGDGTVTTIIGEDAPAEGVETGGATGGSGDGTVTAPVGDGGSGDGTEEPAAGATGTGSGEAPAVRPFSQDDPRTAEEIEAAYYATFQALQKVLPTNDPALIEPAAAAYRQAKTDWEGALQRN